MRSRLLRIAAEFILDHLGIDARDNSATGPP